MWTPNTLALCCAILVGGGVAGWRLFSGLGAVTNMNDVYPWGFWLGFDLLGGVAMAAGGFIIAAAIYLFNWEKYKPIGRPAILTAFLGYLMAVVALFFDLGHPFRMWHPAIMWQVHSIMWIVGIHVMLYTTTLAIESSPMLLERFGNTRALAVVNKFMIAAVVFGVMLSTLHQSSLGAVFLIAPAKMSPLWFSQFMPYMFLISAIAMGLCMVSTEAMLSGRAFNHHVDVEIFRGLARGTMITLSIYLALKLVLLFWAGVGLAFDGTLEGNMYLLEMLLGVIIPLGLLAQERYRRDLQAIMAVNILVIVGVLVNRLNVCVFSMQGYNTTQGGGYFPSFPEFLLSLGVVSLGVLMFKMAAKHLPLFAKHG
jgi:Ni/Fe-hydrogenase subunit HybB-like protein